MSQSEFEAAVDRGKEIVRSLFRALPCDSVLAEIEIDLVGGLMTLRSFSGVAAQGELFPCS